VRCISFDYRKVLYALTLFFVLAEIPTRVAAQETSSTTSTVEPQAEPSFRTDLSAIGFRESSRRDRIADSEPSVSLDFVDAGHILLTFNRKGLFKRQPECTPDHEDRLMHAVILEIPGGKVVTEADWYLHDRRRYLWPLTPGRFLLRKLNKLYTVDSSLHESLLLSSPRDLLWVSVTPDGSQIILETENDKTPAGAAPRSPSKSKPEPRYVVRFLDAKTLAPQRTLLFNNFTTVTGTSTGYADVIRKGDIWLLRFGPTVKNRHNLARVRSQTVPNVLYPTENTLIVGRCALAECNYGVTAFTLTGHRLWRQHWRHLHSYPELIRSGDSSRFAVSTLRVESAVGSPPDDVDPDSPFQSQVSEGDALRQEVQVFDSASGSSVLSVTVRPAVTTGQNVSLSPDGRRFALLRGSMLELFDLPPMSQEEQGKFASLETDVPGLYTVGSNAEPDAAMGNAVEAANSAETAALTADAPAGATGDETPDSHATAHTEENSQAPSGPPVSPSPPTVADPAEKVVQATSPPVPTFKVSSKAVVVDVVVTDGKGRPVRGLHEQDFQLSEDNKPQGVRYFREFNDVDGPASSSTGPASAASASPTLPTSPPTPAAPASSPNVFNNRSQANPSGAFTIVLFDPIRRRKIRITRASN